MFPAVLSFDRQSDPARHGRGKRRGSRLTPAAENGDGRHHEMRFRDRRDAGAPAGCRRRARSRCPSSRPSRRRRRAGAASRGRSQWPAEMATAPSRAARCFVVRKLGVPGHPELAMGAMLRPVSRCSTNRWMGTRDQSARNRRRRVARARRARAPQSSVPGRSPAACACRSDRRCRRRWPRNGSDDGGRGGRPPRVGLSFNRGRRACCPSRKLRTAPAACRRACVPRDARAVQRRGRVVRRFRPDDGRGSAGAAGCIG